jgi:uroporphyrin-III C-methyltransferase
MTELGELRGGCSAETEVFDMAGRQLAALGRRLLAAGWPADTPVSVVSRAGCADALGSEHALSDLAAAALLHKGRPTVVTVGVGATSPMHQGKPLAPPKIVVLPASEQAPLPQSCS